MPGSIVIAAIAGEGEDRDVRRVEPRVDLPQPVGELPVLAHRVGEARDPDQPGVGRDQQDHRGEHADVVAQDVGEARAEPEVLDDPEHRVVGERGPELGRVVAGGVLGDRHRRERDDRQQQRRAPSTASDREPDPARDRPRGVAAPPRPCSRSSRSRCRRSSRPRSRARSRPRSAPRPRWTLLTSDVRARARARCRSRPGRSGCTRSAIASTRLSRDDSSVPLMFSAASSATRTIPPITSPGPWPSGAQNTAR